MPRRKKQNTDSLKNLNKDLDCDESTCKKPKVSQGQGVWEFFCDNDEWHRFSDSTQEELNNAFENGKQTITIDEYGKFTFDKLSVISKMKTTQNLRYCVLSSKEYVTWYRELDTKDMSYFPPNTVKLIEEAFQTKAITSFKIGRKLVTIDTKSMKQVIANEEPITIKRIVSNYEKICIKNLKEKVKSEINVEVKSKTVRLEIGKVPVDVESGKSLTHTVYIDGNNVYDVMLNQTNVGNNNNKFYLIQLLQENKSKMYEVWMRWGRVGYKGQTSCCSFNSDIIGAKREFCKKFREKTKNEWVKRKSFVFVKGKYDLVEIDYNTDKKIENDNADIDNEKIIIPDSKLDERIQNFIKLISDVKAMEAAVIEMKYDARKAPLGKLTPLQIKGGYAALKRISELINDKKSGKQLEEACNEFYTRIPHDFGFKRPTIIHTTQELKEKLQLLETLEDIEIAMNIIKGCNLKENPIDQHYNSLKCDMKPLDRNSEQFKIIDEYLKYTHAPTHSSYKLEIEDVFDLCRNGELEQYNDVGNKMLLWHGSRLTNWFGILSQGLRIAPPEAPVTGYMFGKGVYFADMCTKSANYCFATKSNPTGILLLCEVALGEMNEKFSADCNAHNLPKGKHSTKGVGQMAPDSETYITDSNGVLIPIGKGVNTSNTGKTKCLLYNEFIVYDVKQIRMRYLLRTKFNYTF